MTGTQLDRTDLAARARLEEALLRRRRGAGKAEGIRVLPRRAGELRFRAAVSQEGMWNSLAGDPGPAPVILAGVRIHGALDVALLQDAWDAVVARHETLRSALRIESGQLTQVVAAQLRLPVEVVELELAQFGAFVWAEGERPFDLARGPLARLTLVRLADDDHIAFMMIHHIIGDARTIEVAVRDLAACYTAAAAGDPDPLPPLPVQYADFAAWHRARLEGPRGAELIAYWLERLAGAEPAVLPTDLEPPASPSTLGAGLDVPMPAELYTRISALARERGTTLYTVGLAAFQALLARRSGQRDVCVRAPISYRDATEVRDLVADFSNDVVIRTDLTANPTLRELLEQVKARTGEDFARHDLPPHLLEPHLSDPELVTRLSHVQFTAEAETDTPPALGGLRLEAVVPERRHVLRPLSVRLRYDARRAHCIVLYRTEQFTARRIEELMRDYHELLAEMAAHPENRVFGIPDPAAGS
ncbi:condensation domain-containing protein [Kitasatospora mediocidica]|uniref:condensation domain-containing protein n=1 Tax=Kitasatospora mediocidica TaxID=58352 RepID=UPI00068FF8BF|nr:condensation domain-containing protein [Kitasatospora mediocidica]